ncbi:MAG: hypothetical protein KGM16_05820 [Bacteroidota bacterium]|nr:hypothetical protein [Bacteroidota bacterium]
MRILSNDEQELCVRILKGSGNNNFLGNIIDHKLRGICIDITKNPQNVFLEFTVRSTDLTFEESQDIIDRINEISFFILTTVNLINLLEKEGYILTIQRATQPSNHSKFGGCVGNLPSVTSQFTDKNISDLLVNYCDREMIATEEFKRFCERKFIARDEQRFQRQFLVSILALSVTTIALLVNTFFNLLPKFTGGTKIKQEQIDTLSSGLKSVENKIDSVNKTVSKYKNISVDTNSLQKPKNIKAAKDTTQ